MGPDQEQRRLSADLPKPLRIAEQLEDLASVQERLQSLLGALAANVAEHLQDFVRAQEGLQSLLEAVLAVSQELELPVVLRRIVTTAMDLVDARYGALGVLDEHGKGLSEFIPVGLTAQEKADLAGVGYPRGGGLLGLMIRNTEPLRLDDMAHHPQSAGFPPGHPPMRTLLGVAISVRDQVYGRL